MIKFWRISLTWDNYLINEYPEALNINVLNIGKLQLTFWKG